MIAMKSAHAKQSRLMQSAITLLILKFITPFKNFLATVKNKSGISATKTTTAA
jgi:hypothetical protein